MSETRFALHEPWPQQAVLLCKIMHIVARIIRIDMQLRLIKVVNNWGERYAQGQEPDDVEPRSKHGKKV